MSVPTFISVTPSTGLTGGKYLVAIEGTNFKQAPAPPATGPTPVPNPSVAVYFGTVPALEVYVLSATLLHAVVPIFGGLGAAAGPVDLTISNINQDGSVVGSESVVAAAAFTYSRPNLNSDPLSESPLTRLVRSLIIDLERQVMPNVVMTVQTDYDDTPDVANVAMLSKLPGMVLSGPKIKENMFYNSNQLRTVSVEGDVNRFNQLRPARTVDLHFTLIGVDDSTPRLLNMLHVVNGYFQRNTSFRMLRDASVPGDYVEWEMDIDENDFEVTPAGGNSNVRSFAGGFLIRAFDLDDIDMTVLQTTVLEDFVTVGSVNTPSPVIFDGEQTVAMGGSAQVVGGPDHIQQIPPES